MAIMHQHVTTEAPRLRDTVPMVQPELDAIVSKAIRRDPSQRYQSMDDFRADLQHPSRIDLSQFEWPDQATWAGFNTEVGPMPGFRRAAKLVLAVFAALALLGFLAQFAHQLRVAY
jgi:hypothetical protein